MTFGEYLRATRIMKDMTLAHVAKEIGWTASHIGEIERGNRNPPKTEHIRKLASILSDVDEILYPDAARDNVEGYLDMLLGYRDMDRGFVKIPLFPSPPSERDKTAIMLSRQWLDLGDDAIEEIRGFCHEITKRNGKSWY